MITLDINNDRVAVRPRSLHSYIEKIDYIKSRRPSPYSSLRDLPKQKNSEAHAKFVEIAMMASMKLSAVGLEEELYFDSSFEGFFYTVWQAVRAHFKWSAEGLVGVNQAEQWYMGLNDDHKEQVRFAIRGVDERSLAKNSDGPEENPQEGPEKQ